MCRSNSGRGLRFTAACDVVEAFLRVVSSHEEAVRCMERQLDAGWSPRTVERDAKKRLLLVESKVCEARSRICVGECTTHYQTLLDRLTDIRSDLLKILDECRAKSADCADEIAKLQRRTRDLCQKTSGSSFSSTEEKRVALCLIREIEGLIKDLTPPACCARTDEQIDELVAMKVRIGQYVFGIGPTEAARAEREMARAARRLTKGSTTMSCDTSNDDKDLQRAEQEVERLLCQLERAQEEREAILNRPQDVYEDGTYLLVTNLDDIPMRSFLKQNGGWVEGVSHSTRAIPQEWRIVRQYLERDDFKVWTIDNLTQEH